jgi:hypothetical protein
MMADQNGPSVCWSLGPSCSGCRRSAVASVPRRSYTACQRCSHLTTGSNFLLSPLSIGSHGPNITVAVGSPDVFTSLNQGLRSSFLILGSRFGPIHQSIAALPSVSNAKSNCNAKLVSNVPAQTGAETPQPPTQPRLDAPSDGVLFESSTVRADRSPASCSQGPAQKIPFTTH